MAHVFLGNIQPWEFKKYFGFGLSDEHLKFLKETHQNCADTNKLKAREWHMFDIPKTLFCGSKEFADELIRLLTQYEINGTICVAWNND